jgi:hypothetical protein
LQQRLQAHEQKQLKKKHFANGPTQDSAALLTSIFSSATCPDHPVVRNNS